MTWPNVFVQNVLWTNNYVGPTRGVRQGSHRRVWVTGKIGFYAAFDAVLGELASELAWRYERDDMMAIGLSVSNVQRGVAKLREVGYEPSLAAVDLIARYHRQQN
jgi:hypothetical protein